MWAEKQITKDEAIAWYSSGIWEKWTAQEIVKAQLFQKRLFMPFDKFHEAVEKVLGRGVFTHEFAYVEALQHEYLGEKPPPTFEEIINLIPEEKRVIIKI
jgi:hypothetical protein